MSNAARAAGALGRQRLEEVAVPLEVHNGLWLTAERWPYSGSGSTAQRGSW
jgi:hypothetical protein